MALSVAEHKCLTDQIGAICRRECIGATPIRVRRRSNIYNSGQADSHVYFVESGRVNQMMFSPDGKVCLLSVHGPDEIFGEGCLLEPEQQATASAMKDTVLRRVPAGRFLAALGEEGLLEAFIRYLVNQMAEQQQVILGFATMDSKLRLATALLQLGRKFGRRHPQGLCISERLTQEELSEMVGTTRSRVGFFLKGFGAVGLLNFDRNGFIVVDEKRLANYVGISA
ncbi:Crp/Fnr family transcriptional regulator [Streptomyces yanii]|uniref:Crp/Fnr family transcriptional regulator n=1 Tax=Streptomyces sp. NPDC057486 TaxID=3346145 RepID=UPI003375191F